MDQLGGSGVDPLVVLLDSALCLSPPFS